MFRKFVCRRINFSDCARFSFHCSEAYSELITCKTPHVCMEWWMIMARNTNNKRERNMQIQIARIQKCLTDSARSLISHELGSLAVQLFFLKFEATCLLCLCSLCYKIRRIVFIIWITNNRNCNNDMHVACDIKKYNGKYLSAKSFFCLINYLRPATKW